MRHVWGGVLLFIVLSACSLHLKHPPNAPTSEVTDIKNLAEVASFIPEGGQSQTLLVLDIDDTLLTSVTFFGSDHWYEWQKTLLDNDTNKVTCLFDVIALNYEAGTQKATEEDGPKLINAITIDKLILTARDPMYRGPTIRELSKAKYALPRPLNTSDDGLIYSWRRDETSKPITVSYHNGIFMISGQDKGVLLLDLLTRLKLSYKYKRIVFVDDGIENINAMQKALNKTGIAYHGLHYIGINKKLPIDSREERKAIAGWTAWRDFLSSVFPDRLNDFKAKRCFY